ARSWLGLSLGLSLLGVHDENAYAVDEHVAQLGAGDLDPREIAALVLDVDERPPVDHAGVEELRLADGWRDASRVGHQYTSPLLTRSAQMKRCQPHQYGFANECRRIRAVIETPTTAAAPPSQTTRAAREKSEGNFQSPSRASGRSCGARRGPAGRPRIRR